MKGEFVVTHPIWKVLIPAAQIQRRIDAMAPDIQSYIDSSDVPVVLAFVAQGGLWFGHELGRRLDPETFRWGIVGTSSYGGKEEGGKVDLTFNRTGDVAGHRVLIVDDIGDRRATLAFLKDLFLGPEKAVEVRTCVLLNKSECQKVDIPLDYVGFNIPDTFVAGCGLDGGEHFAFTRNYPNIRYKEGTLPEGTKKFWVPTRLPA